MLTYEQAAALVRRWKILDKYPKLDDGERRLIEALRKAPKLETAETWVEEWIKRNKRCPAVSEVYEEYEYRSNPLTHAANYLPPLPPGVEPPPPEYYCDQCEDQGFYIVKTNRPVPDCPGLYYEAAKKCPHPPERRGLRARM